MDASNETGQLKEEMTNSNLCISVQGIDPGNFSGCDKRLHKCLPKSKANFKFCGLLNKALWIASLTKLLMWKWPCWLVNNGKLNMGKTMEAWEHPQTTFYAKSCSTTRGDPPHFFLHLLHLLSGLSQLSDSISGLWSSYLPHRASCQQDLKSMLNYLHYLSKTSRLEDGRKIFEDTGPAISEKLP